ncbi:MAG TPA: hypothetical protein VMF66_21155 [Candidatus Acidoferrum sp.]|nr:hypothetical protein [Candidatus Acidoferrum sp.]
MAQSILVFDFGANEEAAQQARHKFEGWKQAFRLGDKAVLKFERTANEADAASGAANESKPEKTTKAKPGAKKNAKKKSGEAKGEEAEDPGAETESSDVRVLIRLSFSDHEKLTYQRWLDRIPTEEPFKSAKSETIRHSDPSFAKTADLFDSLD